MRPIIATPAIDPTTLPTMVPVLAPLLLPTSAASVAATVEVDMALPATMACVSNTPLPVRVSNVGVRVYLTTVTLVLVAVRSELVTRRIIVCVRTSVMGVNDVVELCVDSSSLVASALVADRDEDTTALTVADSEALVGSDVDVDADVDSSELVVSAVLEIKALPDFLV